ncbi:MAG: hypothetical protein JWL65_5788 [Gammaproteobacteria bacterium]|jgi:hypothetical protein|nr:hypothetical protein [Gammaproteobacteria bacterium]
MIDSFTVQHCEHVSPRLNNDEVSAAAIKLDAKLRSLAVLATGVVA